MAFLCAKELDVSKTKDSIQSGLANSRDKLWKLLLSEKQFYAFEFVRDQIIEGIRVDFYCEEVKFGIGIESTKLNFEHRLLTPTISKQMKDSGYQIIILSPEEIMDTFEQTVSLLDQRFTSLTRFQCG
jgi:very-short-patch-repair endonuclease